MKKVVLGLLVMLMSATSFADQIERDDAGTLTVNIFGSLAENLLITLNNDAIVAVGAPVDAGSIDLGVFDGLSSVANLACYADNAGSPAIYSQAGVTCSLESTAPGSETIINSSLKFEIPMVIELVASGAVTVNLSATRANTDPGAEDFVNADLQFDALGAGQTVAFTGLASNESTTLNWSGEMPLAGVSGNSDFADEVVVTVSVL
jgi:hypothetical protein